jgi:secreted PhoX family phosphatase
MQRRDFLLLMGASAGTLAIGSMRMHQKTWAMPFLKSTTKDALSFQPIQGPIPLQTDGIAPQQQIKRYSTYQVVDDLVLPQGFQYQVIAAWGDKVGDGRFGYNNDYLSFIEVGQNQGYLSVNFEFVSLPPWDQTFEQVIGKSLPFAEIKQALSKADNAQLNAYALPDDDPRKVQIREISKEALSDQGIGVISLQRTRDGKWERTYSSADRRISGISGLEDGRYLKVTGPAAAVFRKTTGQGYMDQLGDRIIGTFANCAGGTTPWGTVLSAEENFYKQVPEPVYADGTPFDPGEKEFSLDDEEVEGQGNVFGLAGHKYGWIVEVDPANPNDYGTKHTALGRFRHEAVGVRVEAGQQLAFYSGCDRRGGHFYKFVSQERVRNPKDKANSQLLTQGTLYAAKFNPDGTGRWIALNADTPVAPELPSNIVGVLIRLPKRPEGGVFNATTDEQVAQFKQQYKKLGDLYTGDAEAQYGAILIDAHFAANAVGTTSTARPEDIEVAQDGSLYICFTNGTSNSDGGPDKRIFKGPKGETPYEYGWVMRLTEDGNAPAAMSFRWQILATGGEPSAGGMGFANPDNLLLDRGGNLWIVTDVTGKSLNAAVKSRTNAKGKPESLGGIFGNNSMWFLPTQGKDTGKAFLFAIGPMECELTGPCFTADQQTLFLSVQHPGETRGMRTNATPETKEFLLTTTDGKPFKQTRQVPMGSNWPSKTVNTPPKPAVVVITKTSNS